MKISVSKFSSGYPLYYESIEVTSVKHLSTIVTSRVWSPITWEKGRRNTDNFLFSDVIGLDFDEGKSLEEVKAILTSQGIRALIGLTKSHQKEKSGKPPCDRFRVIIPWAKRVNDYNTYRQNIERLSKMLPGDNACKDGARIFQPCVSIDTFLNGSGYEWTPYKEPVYATRSTPDYYKQNGIIPRWVRDMIQQSPGSGERNKHCFRIAAAMSKYGFSEQDCLGAVMSCNADLPVREKMTAAKSGYKAGKK